MAEMKNAYQQKYKSTAVQSASRERLLLMLYEGAIKFMKQAVIAIEKKDLSEKGRLIGRAYDIILELSNTLDHKVGGSISRELESLYMFITDELTQGNIHNDKKRIENALRVMARGNRKT
jgi:flagellar secretion chaperone FliS